MMLARRVAALRGFTSIELESESIILNISRHFSSASDDSSSNKTESGAKLQRKSWDSSSSSSPSVQSRQPRFTARQPQSDRDRRRGKGRQGESYQRRGKGPVTTVDDLLMDMYKSNQESMKSQTKAQRMIAESMAPYAVDTDKLALLKYIMPKGKVEDTELATRKLKANLYRDLDKMQRLLEADIKMEKNPNYQLGNEMTKDPRRVNDLPPSPESLLDEAKERFCTLLGLDDDDFEKHKEIASKNFRETILPGIIASNPRVQEEELQKLVDENLPKDHELYNSVVSKLKTLQNNPYWPHERKVVFMKRLLKNASSA